MKPHAGLALLRCIKAVTNAKTHCMRMDRAPHILVVDADPAIRLALNRGLEAEGYRVTEAGSHAELLRAIEAQPVDLITLDLDLGDADGLAIVHGVRSIRNIPIVIISDRSTTEDQIAGLESGADDYIVKPFALKEVLLRVRNVLRRHGHTKAGLSSTGGPCPHECYKIETGIVDIPRREMRSTRGEFIELTAAEFDLMALFVRRPNRIISRDEMMHLLRGRQWSPLDRSLDKHVARLRKKIEPPGEAPQMIKTVRTIGYVFTANVEPCFDSDCLGS